MPDTSLSTHGSELTLGSFRLSETGLIPVGTPTMEQWLEAGAFINRSERLVHFWIGDWLNFGEKAYGETYKEAVDQTKYDYGTLKNDKWVASRIPPERRKPQLSFSHHYSVADLEPEEQEELLNRAVTDHINNEKFRKLVTEHTKPLQDQSLSRARDNQTPVGAFAERMVELRIELTGLNLAALTTKERHLIGEQCERMAEQMAATLTELANYEDPDDTGL